MEVSMKQKLFGIIVLVAVTIFTVAACGVFPHHRDYVSIYKDEDTPLLEHTMWTFVGGRGINEGIVEFRPDGELFVSSWGQGGKWQRVDNTVKFVTDNGYFHWVGTYNPKTKRISGTFYDSEHGERNFVLEPRK
jgi:hypothetical protein